MENGRDLKPFHETYTISSLMMIMSLMYPHKDTPKATRQRIIQACLGFTTFIPVTIILLLDVGRCFMDKEFLNITRHLTVIIPVCISFMQAIIMNIHRKEVFSLINVINKDFLLYNSKSEDLKQIAFLKVKDIVRFEKYWSVAVVCCAMAFPAISSVQNVYSYLFDDIPKRYMVHVTRLPFKELEFSFQTPYFEIIYVYYTYVAIFLTVNFIAFDTMFGIAIRHACLKMKMCCLELEKAFTHQRDAEIIRRQISIFVKGYCNIEKFVDSIQKTFSLWLGVIFSGTVLHVSNCLLQIIEGNVFDVLYIVFAVVSILHIYLPCANGAVLKYESQEISTYVYCCGWESINGVGLRKSLTFIMARAQKSMLILGCNQIAFDMQLFTSILRATYSLFTLMRQRNKK